MDAIPAANLVGGQVTPHRFQGHLGPESLPVNLLDPCYAEYLPAKEILRLRHLSSYRGQALPEPIPKTHETFETHTILTSIHTNIPDSCWTFVTPKDLSQMPKVSGFFPNPLGKCKCVPRYPFIGMA